MKNKPMLRYASIEDFPDNPLPKYEFNGKEEPYAAFIHSPAYIKAPYQEYRMEGKRTLRKRSTGQIVRCIIIEPIENPIAIDIHKRYRHASIESEEDRQSKNTLIMRELRNQIQDSCVKVLSEKLEQEDDLIHKATFTIETRDGKIPESLTRKFS